MTSQMQAPGRQQISLEKLFENQIDASVPFSKESSIITALQASLATLIVACVDGLILESDDRLIFHCLLFLSLVCYLHALYSPNPVLYLM